MGKKRILFKVNVDKILGLSAILISLLTLIIFIYQTNIIHKQSRLSVTPRLSFSTELNRQDSIASFNLLLKNKGIGPAIINSSKIILNTKEYEVVLDDFFNSEYPELRKLGAFTSLSTVQEGLTLSPNETMILFSYKFNQNNINEIKKHLSINSEEKFPFSIELIYSSIYDEEWKVNSSKNGHPIKLD